MVAQKSEYVIRREGSLFYSFSLFYIPLTYFLHKIFIYAGGGDRNPPPPKKNIVKIYSIYIYGQCLSMNSISFSLVLNAGKLDCINVCRMFRA